MTGHATEPWTHHDAVVNGVRLHYVTAGDGPLVILLHGFPEFWYSWHHQIPALAAAGYRVIAPDMRGYDRSAKPRGVHNYRIEVLADDVAALIRHAGVERAMVAGHDWGGGVAWQMAMRHPTMVEKLVVLNMPHPAAFRRELRRSAQLLRSSYALFFQLPWLPEATLRAFDFALPARNFRKDLVRPHAFSEDDISRYKQAWSRSGALTAMVNLYRAAFRQALANPRAEFRPITAPTMLIWGDQDRFLGRNLTEGLEEWVPGIRVEHIPNASHWVQVDAPERVSELLVEFLSSTAPPAG